MLYATEEYIKKPGIILLSRAQICKYKLKTIAPQLVSCSA